MALAATSSPSKCKKFVKVLLQLFCIFVLCGQSAFLDLFLIHHSEGSGFDRGFMWVVVDGLVVIFWVMGFIMPSLGLGPPRSLPHQPRGSLTREFLYGYMSWLVFAPLLIAKIVRVYNTVPTPSESHWLFTPEMMRIALSMTGISLVLLTHCHDHDVDHVKYKVRIRAVGKVVGFSILDGCDILSMLHVRGSKGEFPTILRVVILVTGCAWFILPLIPMISLRIMAAEKDQSDPLEKEPVKPKEKNEKPAKSKLQDGKALKIQKSDIQRPEIKTSKSLDNLDHPQFERKVIQLRNDMFVSELSSTCKSRDQQRARSYDNLCSDTAAPGRPLDQSKLSQSLNFSYWNYNQNCKVEPLTLEKAHRLGADRKDKSNSFLNSKGDNEVNHYSEDKTDPITHAALRHSKSQVFNVALFQNETIVTMMDIPYLAIRLHLWMGHGIHASVFLTKNIIMILALALSWVYEPPGAIKTVKHKAVKAGILRESCFS